MKNKTSFSIFLCQFLTSILITTFCIQAQSLNPEDKKTDKAAKSLSIYSGLIIHNNPNLKGEVLVDFPFTVKRDQFEFYKPSDTSTGFYARIFAQITLFGLDGKGIDSSNTYFSAYVDRLDKAGQKDIKLFNLLSLVMKPGLYTARLTIIDAVGKAENELFYDHLLIEPTRADGELLLTGMGLAYLIQPANDNVADRLVRNGLKVLYNPLGLYSHNDTIVYIFAELFNIAYPSGDQGEIKISVTALNNDGEIFRECGVKSIIKGGVSAVINESIDISDWPAGFYEIQLKVEDLDNGQVDINSNKMTIIDPSLLIGSSEETGEIAGYNKLSLKKKLQIVRYHLDPGEKSILNRLNEEGKNSFIEQYWSDRDPDTKTKLNEKLQTMYHRYLFANQFFSTDEFKENGWSMDRGRIYMLHGPWEERDDVQAPLIGDPFVIWHYYSLYEGTFFVFEDEHRMANYRLVHSNMLGEIFSPFWEEKIREELYRDN